MYNTCSRTLTALRYKLDFGPSKMKMIAHFTSNCINHATLQKSVLEKMKTMDYMTYLLNICNKVRSS